MDRVYVSGRLTNELRLKQLRNYLWAAIDARKYYKKKEPHITIIPGFAAKDGRLEKVESIINNHEFSNRHIKVNTLSVYENIHKPYVVQLDVEHEFHKEIKQLISKLQRHAKTDITYPNSPHITLFKTEGWWDTIPRENRKRLQEEIISNVGIRDTRLSKIETNIVQ